MFKLIDRQLIFSYVKAYLFCFVSLLGLYIIVDLFNNIDDFAKVPGGTATMLAHIGRYYGSQVTFIFDRLSEAIVMLSAMFTVAWLQRNNELLPLLSAGASTGRIVRPVLLSACGLVFVNVVNQELLIPTIGNTNIRRDDPKMEKNIPVQGIFDSNRVLLNGAVGIRKDKTIINFHCVIPVKIAQGAIEPLQAKTAKYIPLGAKMRTGGWLLQDAKPKTLKDWSRKDVLEPIGRGEYFLYTDVDFDRMTRGKGWYRFMPTWAIFMELGRADPAWLSRLAVFFHLRLTRPLMGVLLVLAALGIVLRDQNRNIFLSMGMCLVLGGVFFGCAIGARYLGENEVLSPALAAWLPVFLFGPVSFVLFDAVHT